MNKLFNMLYSTFKFQLQLVKLIIEYIEEERNNLLVSSSSSLPNILIFLFIFILINLKVGIKIEFAFSCFGLFIIKFGKYPFKLYITGVGVACKLCGIDINKFGKHFGKL